tara:strand:+ start:510 stop:878 length:369 start_codon:yes stop_codon:yes gene_type:complete
MIKPVPYHKTIPFHVIGKKEDLIFHENTNYIGFYKGKILCGIMGYEILKTKSILRSAYVYPEHRSQGLYGKFVEHINEVVRERAKTNIVEATCTVNSIMYHLDRGSEVVKKFKKFTKIRYEA